MQTPTKPTNPIKSIKPTNSIQSDISNNRNHPSTENPSHLIFAYQFDGKGGGTWIDETEISAKRDEASMTWVHMDKTEAKTKAFLDQELTHLDPFIQKALFDRNTRPRMIEINDGMLISLRGANLNKNASPEDMVSVILWIENNHVVSLRSQRLKAMSDIEEKIKLGKAPKDLGELVSIVIEQLFERMKPLLNSLNEQMDDIEQSVLESADTSLRGDIVDIRKKAILFRRYISPQRDVISQLKNSTIFWLNKSHKQRLNEIYNSVTRYIEDLDAVRERAQVVKDELVNTLSDRLNNNLYFLSIISAIFLPLGFLTGLLGINVGGIPGSDNPKAFLIFCLILGAIVGLQIVLLKRKKWL